MAPAARRPAAARSSIPQISWRSPQPAPIVLVSGPEDVCAERAIAGVRDYLRAEESSLEVSDVRADIECKVARLEETTIQGIHRPPALRVSVIDAQ